MKSSQVAPIGIHRAKPKLSRLIDQTAEGSVVVISCHGQPLAVLISATVLERFQELDRRDHGLQAIPRGRVLRIAPWSTPKLFEVLTGLGGVS